VAERKVRDSFRRWTSDNPNFDNQSFASRVGGILDSDQSLATLAVSDPDAAIKVATRIAQAEQRADAVKKKRVQSRRQVAPPAARSGTVVPRKRETMLEAATRALQEAGVNPDSF
jgi:hypothetical protein